MTPTPLKKRGGSAGRNAAQKTDHLLNCQRIAMRVREQSECGSKNGRSAGLSAGSMSEERREPVRPWPRHKERTGAGAGAGVPEQRSAGRRAAGKSGGGSVAVRPRGCRRSRDGNAGRCSRRCPPPGGHPLRSPTRYRSGLTPSSRCRASSPPPPLPPARGN
jgi:hypothetical protein